MKLPLQRSGETYFVTIPEEDLERLGLWEGQMVAIEIAPVDEAWMAGLDVTEAPEGGPGEAAPGGEDREE